MKIQKKNRRVDASAWRKGAQPPRSWTHSSACGPRHGQPRWRARRAAAPAADAGESPTPCAPGPRGPSPRPRPPEQTPAPSCPPPPSPRDVWGRGGHVSLPRAPFTPGTLPPCLRGVLPGTAPPARVSLSCVVYAGNVLCNVTLPSSLAWSGRTSGPTLFRAYPLEKGALAASS